MISLTFDDLTSEMALKLLAAYETIKAPVQHVAQPSAPVMSAPTQQGAPVDAAPVTTPVTPVATSATPSGKLDNTGVPFNPEIHVETITATGQWRRSRKATKEQYESWAAQNKQAIAQSVVQPTAIVSPTPSPAPSTYVLQTQTPFGMQQQPPQQTNPVVDMQVFQNLVSKLANSGALTYEMTPKILQACGASTEQEMMLDDNKRWLAYVELRKIEDAATPRQ